MKTIKQHQLPTADLLNNFEDLKCKMTKEEIIAYNEGRIVTIKSVLESPQFIDSNMALPIALGNTADGEVYMIDLARVPHLLVAGAPGQGNRVCLKTIITSLLYTKSPNELKLVFIDTRHVEFSEYEKIASHYLAALPELADEPIVSGYKETIETLKSLCTLMEQRYQLLSMTKARNIRNYNEMLAHHEIDSSDEHEFMPYIVVVISDYAGLYMTVGRKVELLVAKLAQLASAIGIHLILSTETPSAVFLSGTIKANFPGRIALRVNSVDESRAIIDCSGAERLRGKGDLLCVTEFGSEPIEVQCAYIDPEEVERINDFIVSQPGSSKPFALPEPSEEYQDKEEELTWDSLDPLFEAAARDVVISQNGSTSMIQRHYSIGYSRAGMLMDQLCKAGIVGPFIGSGTRKVLVKDLIELDEILKNIE